MHHNAAAPPLHALPHARRRAVAGSLAHVLRTTAPAASPELHAWAGGFFGGVCGSALGLTTDEHRALAPLLGAPPAWGDAAVVGDGLEPSLDLPRSPFDDQLGAADERRDVLLALALHYLCRGAYDARVRATIVRLARAWGVPPSELGSGEDRLLPLVAAAAAAAAAAADGGGGGRAASSNAPSHASHAPPGGDRLRWVKVGAASLAGAGLLVVTGGLIALPLLGALGALGSTLGVGALTGAAVGFFGSSTAGGALLLTLFGASGGGLAAYKAARKTAGLAVFRFVPLTSVPGGGGGGSESRGDARDRRGGAGGSIGGCTCGVSSGTGRGVDGGGRGAGEGRGRSNSRDSPAAEAAPAAAGARGTPDTVPTRTRPSFNPFSWVRSRTPGSSAGGHASLLLPQLSADGLVVVHKEGHAPRAPLARRGAAAGNVDDDDEDDDDLDERGDSALHAAFHHGALGHHEPHSAFELLPRHRAAATGGAQPATGTELQSLSVAGHATSTAHAGVAGRGDEAGAERAALEHVYHVAAPPIAWEQQGTAAASVPTIAPSRLATSSLHSVSLSDESVGRSGELAALRRGSAPGVTHTEVPTAASKAERTRAAQPALGSAPGLHVFILVAGTAAEGAFKLAATTAAARLPVSGAQSNRRETTRRAPAAAAASPGPAAAGSSAPAEATPAASAASTRPIVDELALLQAALPDMPAALVGLCGPLVLPWGGFANAAVAASALAAHTGESGTPGVRGAGSSVAVERGPSVAANDAPSDTPDDGQACSSHAAFAAVTPGDGGVFYGDEDDEFDDDADVGALRECALCDSPLVAGAASPYPPRADVELRQLGLSPAQLSDALVTDAATNGDATGLAPRASSVAPPPRAPVTPLASDTTGDGTPATPGGGPIAAVKRVLSLRRGAPRRSGAGGGGGVRAGWLRQLLPHGEAYALVYEPDVAANVSRYVSAFMLRTLTNTALGQVLAHTALGALLAAWQLPAMAVNALSFIDAPWTLAVTRADKAAVALADALSCGAHGRRPVSLIGWGLGARVVFKALELLAERADADAASAGDAAAEPAPRGAAGGGGTRSSSGAARRRAFGAALAAAAPAADSPPLSTTAAAAPDPWDPDRSVAGGASSAASAAAVPGPASSAPGGAQPALPTGPLPACAVIQDVFLFGTPAPTTPARWNAVRRVAAGRVVNGYCARDFVLRFVYRSSSLHGAIAGLGPLGGGGGGAGSGESGGGGGDASGHCPPQSDEASGHYPSQAPRHPDRDAGCDAGSGARERGSGVAAPALGDAAGGDACPPAAPPAPAAAATTAAVSWWRGIESIDVASVVGGHLDYAGSMGALLTLVRAHE